MSTIPPRTIERFLSKVEKSSEPDGCWLWRAGRYRTDYGAFCVSGRMVRANRFAYEAFVGPIPEGLDVLHSCDVRACVNPDHLKPGTHRKNMAEAAERGRMASGDRNGTRTHPERHGLRNDPSRAAHGERAHKSNLTEVDVRTIRRDAAAGVRQSVLAARYGVSQTAIFKIVKRETWGHVTDS